MVCLGGGFIMQKKNKVLKKLLPALAAIMVLCLVLSGCGGTGDTDGTSQAGDAKETLVMGDGSWDSIKIHNRIAGFIIEHGYGYPEPKYTFGDTLPLLQGLAKGDVDIYMEVWAGNWQETWEEILAGGSVKDLGTNIPDGPQGWYVPTYMITGDPERGIEPVAPDLKAVFDLPQYWELFKDPEVPDKGRFYNSPPGWSTVPINEAKLKTYGLDDTFNSFSSGSEAALVTSMVTAYEKGEPWLGSYYEPTWVMGKLDMTMLEEPPYDEAVWNDENNRGCAYPNAEVLIGVRSELETTAPDIVDFLKNYYTTLEQNNDFLAYMSDHEGDNSEAAAAIYFLKTYPEVWQQWLPDDVIANVEQALEKVAE
jgi:glycine betaine/proline transport system substrate-binding protein